jgi:hypothetical protein
LDIALSWDEHHDGRVLQVIDEHRKGYEFVWFTNPFPLASIPSVRRPDQLALMLNRQEMNSAAYQAGC